MCFEYRQQNNFYLNTIISMKLESVEVLSSAIWRVVRVKGVDIRMPVAQRTALGQDLIFFCFLFSPSLNEKQKKP